MTFHSLFNIFRSALLLALLFPAAVAAQPRVEVDENEKAIFAFYRLIGKDPDYRLIGQAGVEYTAAPPELKEQILEETIIRLKTGFGLHDINKDFLRITTKIQVQLRAAENGSPPVFIFHFPNSGNENYVPYFPYAMGAEGWIALLVEDLPEFSRIPLTEEQYVFVKSHLPQDGTPYETTLHLRVRPKSADGTSPIELDGVPQWMMMGDVAYISCSLDGKTLWEYAAPWYLSDAEKALLPLLGGQ